jgi:hypothetical protein
VRLSSVAVAGAILALSGVAKGRAAEVSPIYGLQMLLGQNFYTGQRGSLSGNASALVAPAVKFDENWALLPSLSSSFQGTQQVLDVVGAGTLFQSQWDNRLGVKAMYTPDDSKWRLKPNLTAKYQMLQQTKDESLGSGLFDYYKVGAGFDAEYIYKEPFGLRMGVDFFETRFPNYSSLESQVATSFQGQSLARELVGDHVLDTRSMMVTAAVDGPVSDRFIVEGSAGLLYQRFPNQHVVSAAGDLVSPLREDVITMLGSSFKMPGELNSDLRLLGSLDLGLTYESSNQNSYDATQAQFIRFYYNYGELKVGPNVKFLFGPVREATVLSFGATYWHRRYPYRQLQDSSGAYVGGATHMNNWMVNSSVTYPMAPHFSLVFNVQYGRGTSNQTYEQFYKYNYSTTNYLFGFSYDY